MAVSWEDIGRRIEAERALRGWSLRKAGAAGGMSATSWAEIEKAVRAFTPFLKAAVCQAFGWPPGTIDRIAQGDDVDLSATVSYEGVSATALASLVPRSEFDALVARVEALEGGRGSATVTPLRPERRAALETDSADDVERGAPTHQGGKKKPRPEG